MDSKCPLCHYKWSFSVSLSLTYGSRIQESPEMEAIKPPEDKTITTPGGLGILVDEDDLR